MIGEFRSEAEAVSRLRFGEEGLGFRPLAEFSPLGICQLLSKGNQVNIPEPARGDWSHSFRGVWPSAVTQPNSEMLALVTGRVIFSL